jgi:hypothetical protein
MMVPLIIDPRDEDVGRIPAVRVGVDVHGAAVGEREAGEDLRVFAVLP